MPPIDPRLVTARRFPVHAAVDRCNEVEVHRIVDDDAPFHLPRKIPDKETSVVHFACMSRNVPANIMENILRYLIQMGAPLHDLDAAGQTPLHYAACNPFGHRLTKALLSSGCDLHVQRHMDRWTALHLAVTFGNVRTVQLLLRAGADPLVQDIDGRSPLDLANYYRQYDICDILRRARFVPKELSYPAPLFDEVLQKMDEAEKSGLPISANPIKLKEEQVNWRDPDSQETAFHILLRLSPQIHPKFILKRKDLTKEVLNARDVNNNSALMTAAMKNRPAKVEKILGSKNVKENKLLDLTEVDQAGKSVLHYLIEHEDLVNFQALLEREELTGAAANQPTPDGQTPLSLCLKGNLARFVEAVFEAPGAIEKFQIDTDHEGSSVLHIVAAMGNLTLWEKALTMCDIGQCDEKGNTAIMKAAQCGHEYLVQSALKVAGPKIVAEQTNKEGDTLIMLAIQTFDETVVRPLIEGIDHKKAINVPNKLSMTALVLAATLNKWSLVRFLLDTEFLKDDKGNGIIDVHLQDRGGQTPLVLVLLTRIKLHRMEQSFLIKNDMETAKDIRAECDALWEVVKLILEREKEIHGPTMIKGRDGGSESLKKQMNVNKTIQLPVQQDVCREYGKLYSALKSKKSLSRQTSAANEAQSSEVNALESHKLALKPISRQTSLTSKEEPKKKEDESKAIPKISLEDLRSPDALQDAIAKISQKIEAEMKKPKKKKISTDSKEDESMKETSKEEDRHLKVKDGADSEGESPREWSPTPTPRMRRIPSIRKKSSTTEEKPPIPLGPSPPPPETREDQKDPKSKLPSKVKGSATSSPTPKRNQVKSFVEDSKNLINIPLKLGGDSRGTKDALGLKKSKSGTLNKQKQVKSMIEPLSNGQDTQTSNSLEFPDRIVADATDHDGSILVVGPDEHPRGVGKVFDRLKVALREELIVEDALGEGEAIPLLLPQVDLVHHRSRNDILGLLHLVLSPLLLCLLLLPPMGVHLEEFHDLRGCYSASEGLPDGIASDHGHGQIGES
eukprot:maker-scaffold176_size284796-snap-gene-0.15 protein:Tk06851 transcript:maker-scaffold176_size284796-snap-gene-0.15-mRNA-1 annotation:"hypothetical protein COCHEDRAFT_1105320"